jgi:hypothetical protein
VIEPIICSFDLCVVARLLELLGGGHGVGDFAEGFTLV